MNKKLLFAVIIVGLVLASSFGVTASDYFVGSKNSDVYHYPDCYWADKIKHENLVYFDTAEDAINAGYRPCKVCKPPTPSSTSPSTSPTSPPTPSMSTASVHLHGEKTDVVLGEDVLLKLSAVNLIGNPTMHVQVIIIPPSGWSVTSSEFAKSGAGQYTTTYDIEQGGGRDIEVRIFPNQIGDGFQVQGRIIYYFGDDLTAREDHTLTLPIKVRAEPSTSNMKDLSMSGFGAAVAITGLAAVAYLMRRR
jgi:PGF-CTERM protein